MAEASNHVIRTINASGHVSKLARTTGQTGSTDDNGGAARFNLPIGVAVDAVGNVYVTDSANSAVRKIDVGRNVTTVFGVSGQIGVRPGAPSAARLNNPAGIAVLDTTRLLIVDSEENVVLTYTLP